jgi:amino acid transporter
MSALDQFGYKEQLSRALSTRDLIVYGMIFMVPIAPYGVFGFVWVEAKGMVPLAYLIGLVGMFFTAMSYAAMSRAFPLAGSVYTYAHRGLHEIAGFFSGWLILLDYMLVPALLYLFSAVALRPHAARPCPIGSGSSVSSRSMRSSIWSECGSRRASIGTCC